MRGCGDAGSAGGAAAIRLGANLDHIFMALSLGMMSFGLLSLPGLFGLRHPPGEFCCPRIKLIDPMTHEPAQFHSDGIAYDQAGGLLYYQALTGRTDALPMAGCIVTLSYR